MEPRRVTATPRYGREREGPLPSAKCPAARSAEGSTVNVSAPFIARPVATTLLTLGIVLAGVVAFFRLPVAPLPQVDFPT
ncbi:MAG: efflux RND transporter permease subunit, partial [Casimicrobiaceae bacterium]